MCLDTHMKLALYKYAIIIIIIIIIMTLGQKQRKVEYSVSTSICYKMNIPDCKTTQLIHPRVTEFISVNVKCIFIFYR